jgi:peptidoglycan-associated lipoprotein
MRIKMLTAIAAAALLAGCAHKAAETATQTSGAEQATQGGTTSVSVQEELRAAGDRIFFDFDKSDISAEARATLERQAAFAQKHADLTFTIEGHCDERGTREYNLALGERRATSDKNALEALGDDGSRLHTISYGKERPAVVGHNEAAWSQNRRAVLVIN